MKNLIRYIVSTCILLCLSGCGFQLRNQNYLPFHTLYLQSGAPYADFEITLQHTLQSLGVKITSCANGELTLHIISTQVTQDVPTIGGSNQARAYTYYFQVVYEILDREQHVLSCPHTISTHGTIVVNAGEALGSNDQVEIINREMHEEATHEIINRLHHCFYLRRK